MAGEVADGDALGLVARGKRVAAAGGEAARAVVELDRQGRGADDGQVGLAVAVEVARGGAHDACRRRMTDAEKSPAPSLAMICDGDVRGRQRQVLEVGLALGVGRVERLGPLLAGGDQDRAVRS